LIRRHGTPETAGWPILHEGLIGVSAMAGCGTTYKAIERTKNVSFKATNAWLGITDKSGPRANPRYQGADQAQFSFNQAGTQKTYQTDYLGRRRPSRRALRTTNARLFASAKSRGRRLREAGRRQRFGSLIDWGWFYFITKPMFYSID
jgi:YidC/Oxa1 family membrane protein insertase